MVGTTVSPVFARRVGAALKAARDRAGLTTRQVGDMVGKDHTTISRYERGSRIPDSDTVAVIGQHLGLSDSQIGALVASVEHGGGPQWIATGHQDREVQVGALLAFEQLAERVYEVSPLIIPGLFQTPEYTRAIMLASGVPGWDIEARVATRTERSKILLRRPNPVQMTALIGEEALMKSVGGLAVMREQLLELYSWADPDRPNIDIRIVPRTSGYYPGMTNAYFVMEFPGDEEPVVHAETVTTGHFYFQPADVTVYRKGVDTVRGVALGREESRDLIAHIAYQYERESESVA